MLYVFNSCDQQVHYMNCHYQESATFKSNEIILSLFVKKYDWVNQTTIKDFHAICKHLYKSSMNKTQVMKVDFIITDHEKQLLVCFTFLWMVATNLTSSLCNELM